MGIPDVLVEDGSGGELGDFGILGLGTDAIAFPMRDLGLLFALTSPPLSRVSSLLAKKLAVLAKVLMSSCLTLRFCNRKSQKARKNCARGVPRTICVNRKVKLLIILEVW